MKDMPWEKVAERSVRWTLEDTPPGSDRVRVSHIDFQKEMTRRGYTGGHSWALVMKEGVVAKRETNEDGATVYTFTDGEVRTLENESDFFPVTRAGWLRSIDKWDIAPYVLCVPVFHRELKSMRMEVDEIRKDVEADNVP